MNPKDKAKKIYYKMLNELLKDSELIIKQYVGLNIQAISKQSEINCTHAKQCSLIFVDEIINSYKDCVYDYCEKQRNYYEQVKAEIEKL